VIGRYDKPERCDRRAIPLRRWSFWTQPERLQAEALAMAGLANARMGKTDEARALLNKAISILEGVQKHRETSEPLRLSAAQVPEFARQQRSALR
jgi:hypothetical protein